MATCVYGCSRPGASYRSGMPCPGCTQTGEYRVTDEHTKNELSAYLADLEISEGPTQDSSFILSWSDVATSQPLQELVSAELAHWLRQLKTKWNEGGYVPWTIYETESTDQAMRIYLLKTQLAKLMKEGR